MTLKRRKGDLAIGAILFGLVGCAAHAVPAARNDDDGRERRRIPHECVGAAVRVLLPPLDQSFMPVDQSPTEVLRELGEYGPEPPPEETHAEPMLGEGAARAVQRAIEATIPVLACQPHIDQTTRRWTVDCEERGTNECETSSRTAQQFLTPIREIVTPAVAVSIHDCKCRIY